MSLCFNWSCDFQRFTKSKKLSKFQVRTTTLFILNKSLSTSLFNLQGAICCNKHFIELFQALNRSSNSLFSISKLEPFVKNFFRFIFQSKFVHTTNFSVLRLPRGTALIEYQISEGKSSIIFKSFRLLLLFFLHQTDHKRRD